MKSPSEIARSYVDAGSRKAILPLWKMFVLAIFAGMFIAFGAFASSVVSYGIVPAALGRLLGALVFPIGLMLVLVAGGELFTGNCLIIMPVLQHRSTVSGMLYNWGVVYAGNFIGSMLVALAVTKCMATGSSALYGGALVQTMISTATAKVNLSFIDAILRGILCNTLVCLAVWVSFVATDLSGKVMSLYLPIALFVLCGFEHSVANMYFIPVGLLSAAATGAASQAAEAGLTWLTFLYKNLLPVTIGNIIGGTGIVGIGYWFVYLQGHREHP